MFLNHLCLNVLHSVKCVVIFSLFPAFNRRPSANERKRFFALERRFARLFWPKRANRLFSLGLLCSTVVLPACERLFRKRPKHVNETRLVLLCPPALDACLLFTLEHTNLHVDAEKMQLATLWTTWRNWIFNWSFRSEWGPFLSLEKTKPNQKWVKYWNNVNFISCTTRT